MSLGQEKENSKDSCAMSAFGTYVQHYNVSHNWNITKKHLLVIWKGNDITYDMANLQAQIFAVRKSHVESAGIEDLAQSINLGLWFFKHC